MGRVRTEKPDRRAHPIDAPARQYGGPRGATSPGDVHEPLIGPFRGLLEVATGVPVGGFRRASRWRQGFTVRYVTHVCATVDRQDFQRRDRTGTNCTSTGPGPAGCRQMSPLASSQMPFRSASYVPEGEVTRTSSASSLRKSSVSSLNCVGCSIMGACPHLSMK